MSVNALRGSLSVRAVLALAVVFAGYVLASTHFAAFDSAIVGDVLGALGFDVSRPEPGRLLVQSGETYDVYAVVTGACSSAAGALGIGAAALILLPGAFHRRLIGAILAIALYVALNVLRIVGILSLGWIFATLPREVLLGGLVTCVVACLTGAVRLARSLVMRAALLLAAVVLAVLAFDVWRGYDYSVAIASYHALAGPLLTFGSLALALLLLWRVVVGRRVAATA